MRVPQIKLSWEIFSFTHSCFVFAILHSHPSVSFPASSPSTKPPGSACLGKSSVPAGSDRTRSLYPVEGSAEMGTGAELLDRAHGETSLDKGLKVKALLPV